MRAYDDKVLNKVENVQRDCKTLLDLKKNWEREDELTHDFVLKLLVFVDRIAVPFSLMLFSTEIFYSLVVQQTISVDPTSDLVKVNTEG